LINVINQNIEHEYENEYEYGYGYEHKKYMATKEMVETLSVTILICDIYKYFRKKFIIRNQIMSLIVHFITSS
jgi:phosphoenolpyruvate synthase/pyruvate phosphate dikinase